MAPADTKTLIEGSVARFLDEVPALRSLALVVRFELRERGGPAVWRVEVPGPTAKRDPAADAKLAVVMERGAFNQLATKGHLEDWVSAYVKGVLRVTGDPNIMKLIAKVVEMRRAKLR